MTPKIIPKLILSILISELAGVIGAFFTTPAISTWYATINKPAFNPPAWVFGPVWTILFLLMGIAAFLVWQKLSLAKAETKNQAQTQTGKTTPKPGSQVSPNPKSIKLALLIFLIQLALNTLWSIIFFGLHNPGAALLELIILWLAILVTIIAFAKISRPAAWLLVPYILWVSFAGYLNYSIWSLNKINNSPNNINNIININPNNNQPNINQPNQPNSHQPVACTMEAKLCPDGSAVGRTGPNCEFAPCPGE